MYPQCTYAIRTVHTMRSLRAGTIGASLEQEPSLVRIRNAYEILIATAPAMITKTER
jgi:hypothetical protein